MLFVVARLNLRGFAVGVLVTVVAQFLARWLIRQAWLRQAVAQADQWVRRTSGFTASSSDSFSMRIGNARSLSRSSSSSSVNSNASSSSLNSRVKRDGLEYLSKRGKVCHDMLNAVRLC